MGGGGRVLSSITMVAKLFAKMQEEKFALTRFSQPSWIKPPESNAGQFIVGIFKHPAIWTESFLV